MNPRVERALLWLALAAWLAAWFLPVIDGYSGWAAFLAALEGPFRHTFPTPPEDSIPQVFSALTNIAFPIMSALIWRERSTHPARLLRVAIICLVLNLYWLVQAARAGEWKGLRSGYYAWLVPFALVIAILISRVVSDRRTSKTPTAGTPA